MATSTLVQLLSTEAQGGSAASMNRSQEETFIAGGTIAAGDWVSWDATGQTLSDAALYVIEAIAVGTVGNSLAFGVAKEAAVSGAKVRVCIGGYCVVASVPAATVQGSALIGPVTVAGQATIEVPGTTSGNLCGVALGADTANFAEVMVIKQF